tara:strand:+ start:4755 stop:5189 length:435 start_codon:yes stop_codon:yes gene_type:complete
MLKEISDAFKGRALNYVPAGPVFTYHGHQYQVAVYHGTSFEQIAAGILSKMKEDEGFAIYTIDNNKIRGAILPVETFYLGKVVSHENKLALKFPPEMLEDLQWKDGDLIEYDFQEFGNNLIIINKDAQKRARAIGQNINDLTSG